MCIVWLHGGYVTWNQGAKPRGSEQQQSIVSDETEPPRGALVNRDWTRWVLARNRFTLTDSGP